MGHSAIKSGSPKPGLQKFESRQVHPRSVRPWGLWWPFLLDFSSEKASSSLHVFLVPLHLSPSPLSPSIH